MQQEHYEKVFSYLGDAIVMADEDSRILFCNEAFTQLFEYRPEEIIGQPLSVLMEPEYSSTHAQRLGDYINSDAAARSMTSRSSTMLCHTRTGRPFPAKISIARLSSRSGNIGLAIVHDVSHVEREKQELETLARTDGLTRLLNRTYLDELLKCQTFPGATDKQIGILFIDLNDFKLMNDNFGHAIGDSVLNIVGLRIRNAVRDSDLAFRYGGDEFLIFAMNIDSLENLQTLSEKVSESITRVMNIDGKKLTTGCSIGVSLYSQDAENIACAIDLADQDMYRNKHL